MQARGEWRKTEGSAPPHARVGGATRTRRWRPGLGKGLLGHAALGECVRALRAELAACVREHAGCLHV